MLPRSPRPSPGTTPRLRARLRPRAGRAALLGLALAACNHDEGLVELNWAFVDRNMNPVYPGATGFSIRDSCGFTGPLVDGGASQRYALHAELRVCNTGCDCDDPSCLAIAPQRFPCDRARATVIVPTVETQRFTFETVIVAVSDDVEGCECAVQSPCGETPGPRDRAVNPGLVTDLQVQQFVLATLNLEGSVDADAITTFPLAGCCDATPECQ
ncbi:MAG: hypothetical protein KC636_24060 [Myxococcales bacterium]|nr:hypothetical protein [Myxococcales bacterium]